MQKFRAKTGYLILIPLLVLFIGFPAHQILNGAPTNAIITMAAIMIPVTAFTLNIFFGTHYTINEKKELMVKCGIIYHSKIDISSIKSISKTWNPISSPAPSLDRLEIKYGKWDSVIVSPREKQAFIQALQEINPDIKTQLISQATIQN